MQSHMVMLGMYNTFSWQSMAKKTEAKTHIMMGDMDFVFLGDDIYPSMMSHVC